MQAPDDVDLNIAYAKAQADSGHLLSAAAALERVLMLKPNAASVRLLYAVVLYRLDDLQGANAQLAMVDGAQLPALERKELDKYRRVVDSGRKDTKVHGQLAAGIAYNSDALGALVTEFDFTGKGAPREVRRRCRVLRPACRLDQARIVGRSGALWRAGGLRPQFDLRPR